MLLKYYIMPLIPQCRHHFNTMPLGGRRSGITIVASVVEMSLSKVKLHVSCEDNHV
jgi:hypothetical protein